MIGRERTSKNGGAAEGGFPGRPLSGGDFPPCPYHSLLNAAEQTTKNGCAEWGFLGDPLSTSEGGVSGAYFQSISIRNPTKVRNTYPPSEAPNEALHWRDWGIDWRDRDIDGRRRAPRDIARL